MCKKVSCRYAFMCDRKTVIWCSLYEDKTPTGCEISVIMDEIDGVITLTESA